MFPHFPVTLLCLTQCGLYTDIHLPIASLINTYITHCLKLLQITPAKYGKDRKQQSNGLQIHQALSKMLWSQKHILSSVLLCLLLD